ncbi:hypothetical protein Tco_0816484 [Tanacetum coccineum]
MKMKILLKPTSNKLMVEHAEFDESNTHVLERFYTSAGNPVKEILLKLNLPDHRKLKDGGEVLKSKNFKERFLCHHSDTERLSRSDEVLKLKNFKKDATLKLFKLTNQERYEHVMAALVISISSDSYDESVGSLVLRVILFGTIPTGITVILVVPAEVPIALADPLVALEVGAVSVISRIGVLNLVDYSSSFDSDPLEDSLLVALELPLVSPFLCTDDSEADSLSESAE